MNTSVELIQGRLNAPIAIQALQAGSPLPDEIQWMPPGTHRITPHVGGKPQEITIHVDAQLAARFAAEVERMRAEALAGTGDYPFLDFNHKDDAQSAEVTALRWAGEDPKTGGIRAAVSWSKAGRDAIEGRTYRRFSPQWFSDPKTGKPVGLGVNLGGLVNRAAFQTIQSVVARNGVAQPTDHPMTEQEKAELQQIVAGAVKPLADRVAALETKASAGPDLSGITNRLQALETQRQEGALVAARGKIAALVAEGKLPPADTAGNEALAKAIVADPTVEATLAKLAVNPAFKTVTGSSGTGGGNQDPENFPKAIEAAMAAGAKTKSEALDIAMAKHPQLYRHWVQTGGSL